MTTLNCIRVSALCLALAACADRPAFGQALHRAAFVANNGNLEGSVSSYRVNDDGTLTFIMKFVTGSTPSTSMPVPGTNAQTISITPDGRFLMTGHGTSSTTVEQLTVLQVAGDGTLSLAATFTTPDSPLDVQWLSDQHVAVTHTNLSVPNEVLVYAFDPQGPSLTLIDQAPTGSFSSFLALHPSGEALYAQDSTANTVRAFHVSADGTLDLIEVEPTPGVFPLGPGISPDGTKLFAGGGISSGGHAVSGLHVAPDGSLTLMSGSPFFSPGTSPKQVVVSNDNAWAFVAHGTDSTVRTFAVDGETGALTETGFLFDVGVQGSLGEIAVLDDWLLVIDRDTLLDGIRGLYSFTIESDGSLTQNGPIVDSTGITPNALAVWSPDVCAGDFDGDCDADLDDHAAFAACLFGPGFVPMPPAPMTAGLCLAAFDADDDSDVDAFDFADFAAAF